MQYFSHHQNHYFNIIFFQGTNESTSGRDLRGEFSSGAQLACLTVDLHESCGSRHQALEEDVMAKKIEVRVHNHCSGELDYILDPISAGRIFRCPCAHLLEHGSTLPPRRRQWHVKMAGVPADKIVCNPSVEPNRRHQKNLLRLPSA